MKWMPGTSVSQKIVDIFRNYNKDTNDTCDPQFVHDIIAELLCHVQNCG